MARKSLKRKSLKRGGKKTTLRLKKGGRKSQKNRNMKGGKWPFTQKLLGQTGGGWPYSGGKKYSRKNRQSGGWGSITPILI